MEDTECPTRVRIDWCNPNLSLFCDNANVGRQILVTFTEFRNFWDDLWRFW
jgi:hypothetical protein